MRAITFASLRAGLLATVIAASVAGAQAPTPQTPAAPKAPGGGGGEFRVGGFMISGDRSVEFNNSVANAQGSIQGLDVVLRARAIGFQFKSLTGDFGSLNHVTSADLRLLLFPPVFTVMVGAGRRALWSEINQDAPTIYDLGMVGLSSTVVIGGSGLRTNFSAAVYVPAKPQERATPIGQTSATLDKGMEGEASILWRVPKMPLYLQAGYRTEVFTSKNGTRTTPEEVRGVKLGGGVLFGGR